MEDQTTLKPTDRAHALSRILAAWASQDPAVVSFRRGMLRGRLLKPEHVPTWIEREVEAQGDPTLWVRTPLDERGRPRLPRPGTPFPPGVSPETELLSYHRPGSEWLNRAPVRVDAPLWRLKAVAHFLEQEYGWSEPFGVYFVLTGLAPPPVVGRVSTRSGATRGADRVILEIDPRVSPTEVARLYQKHRAASHLRTPSRELSPESCELAVFAAEVNDGRTWAQALEEWRKRHPDHSRPLETFVRDARLAYQRVTGERLEWSRRQGERRRS